MQSQLMLLSLVSGAFFGILCSKFAAKKNRNIRNWLLLGFFFGFFALIVIYFLPSKASKSILIKPSQKISITPAAMNKFWYYLDNKNARFGPMSSTALSKEFFEGKLSASTYLWTEPMKDWKKLKDIKELASLLEPTN